MQNYKRYRAGISQLCFKSHYWKSNTFKYHLHFWYISISKCQRLAYRTIPLIRSELDKQLTTIILVQVIFTCCAILPAFIISLIISYSSLSKDPLISAILQLLNILTVCLYYMYFAVSLILLHL